MSAALIILIIFILLVVTAIAALFIYFKGEKAGTVVILIVCLFITLVCFINTGMLWSIDPESDDAVDLSSGYRNFVSGANLAFGLLFFIISGYFLLRILGVYGVELPGWLNKLRDAVTNFSEKIGLEKKKLEADADAYKTGKKILSKPIFDGDISVERKYGKTVLSCPSDKNTAVPEIIGVPKIDNRITFGDFEFKKNKQIKFGSASPKPLDALKEYYISQKLSKNR